MAERHRLFADHILFCDVRRANETGPGPRHYQNKDHAAKDRHARDRVQAAVKDLRHRHCCSNRDSSVMTRLKTAETQSHSLFLCASVSLCFLTYLRLREVVARGQSSGL